MGPGLVGGKAPNESLQREGAEALPFLGFCQQRPGLYPPQLLALQRGREGFQIRIYGINGFFSACLPHCKPQALLPWGPSLGPRPHKTALQYLSYFPWLGG